MDPLNQDIYPFYERSFEYNNHFYRVILTPELYASGDDEPAEGFEELYQNEFYKGLDFTGGYLVIVTGSKKGSFPLRLEPDGNRWSADEPGMDPGLIDRLNDFILEIRNGKWIAGKLSEPL